MKPSFYASIADNYDYIFPYNPLQVEFIKKQVADTTEQMILEIGCGTGNLAFGLADNFQHVFGIDLDDEMLAKANEKNEYQNLHFQKLNMLKLENVFKTKSIDNIVCFGNTLVHLQSIEEIELFIRSAKQGLVEGGSLFIQIINYDRILNQNIDSLETIENERIQFVRNYKYLKQEHKIDFQTKLTLKENNEVIRNSQLLYPLRKQEIFNVMKKYFNEIHFYGNFKGDSWEENSVPLIISAK